VSPPFSGLYLRTILAATLKIYDGVENSEAIFHGGVVGEKVHCSLCAGGIVVCSKNNGCVTVRKHLHHTSQVAGSRNRALTFCNLPLTQARSVSKRVIFPYYSSTVGSGPNGTWPPLLAVRDKQYKLHLYTKGGGRPATGRADWTYRDADVYGAVVAVHHLALPSCYLGSPHVAGAQHKYATIECIQCVQFLTGVTTNFVTTLEGARAS
jgi:hypothetical protein